MYWSSRGTIAAIAASESRAEEKKAGLYTQERSDSKLVGDVALPFHDAAQGHLMFARLEIAVNDPFLFEAVDGADVRMIQGGAPRALRSKRA